MQARSDGGPDDEPRGHGGGGSLAAIQRDLQELRASLGAGSSTGGQSARDGQADIARHLTAAYRLLYEIDLEALDLDEIRHEGPKLQEAIFTAITEVRSAIADWDAAGLADRDVQAALRNVFRAARVAIDMLGEVYLHHPRLAAGQASNSAFAGGRPFLLVAPAFAAQPVRLLPGDVVLQRGMLHNSAAIARIGDIDSNFSHAAMVAEGDDGRPVIIEALIERGIVVTPLKHALAHNLGRALLLRHRDRELAGMAAQRMLAVVQRSHRAGPPILYDFSMELAGYERLFCSKLVRMAYDVGSDGACLLPRFKTRLDMRNRDFVDRIGVSAHETFSPGDMEIEPAFDIVAEWRDYRVTSELRLKDMIMTKLLAWMEADGYRFHPDVQAVLAGVLGRASTHLPEYLQEMVGRLVARVPPNMTRSAIEAVTMLHKTAEPLYRELAMLEDETIRATGRPLHPRHVLEVLEQIRRRQPTRIGYLVQPFDWRKLAAGEGR